MVDLLMTGYTPALLDEIRASVDVVDLVGRFVNLKKAGVNWKGLCPFHAEKTPSFMVNPRKGIFHCFGCGVGGDAFGFLMRQDKLSFPEAVRALARQGGVALPEDRSVQAAASGREELHRVMDVAARFYAEALAKPGGAQARAYLDKRGIAAEAVRQFGLGLSPDGWDGILTFMRGERATPELLETVGLAVKREGGGFYDRFRGRLMFPIRDLQGRVVAFGGRAFGDEPPKYLNSPETPLYTKGNILYAADLARATIRDRNRALLVEGYVDCLMAHQHGFTETVAALGTALTSAQLGVLRRYCDEVVMFFDADAAGQKAAERAEALLDMTAGAAFWDPASGGATWINRSGEFRTPGTLRVKVALLPPGQDPDTFLRTEGAPAFAARIAEARSILAYAFDRAMADPDGQSGPRARATAFARVALMLAKVADSEEAAELSHQTAARLGVDPTQLWIEAQKLQRALRKPVLERPASPAGVRAEDRALVRLLVHHPAARSALLPLLDDQEVHAEPLRAILSVLRARPEAEGEHLLTDLDGAARDLLAALLFEEDEAGRIDPHAAIADFRRRLELGQRRRRIREMTRSIAEAPDTDTPPLDQLRLLEREGRQARASALGIAQAASPGTQGPQGVADA